MPKKTKSKITAAALPASLVTFLLDKSGSMSSCRDATIEAFNAYLSGLKAEKEAAIDFTFLQFDTHALEKICVKEPIASVPMLSTETYQPRGGTPLVDAAYDTIVATATAVEKRGDNPKVIVAIQTDGEENSSSRYTFEDLTALIAEKTKLGWEFVFMGAGINAYNQGARMGISSVNTMSYDHTSREKTVTAFAESAMNTASFSAGRRANMSYTGLQRMASGDRWASPDLMKGVPVHPAPKPLKPVAQPLDLSGQTTQNEIAKPRTAELVL